MTPIDSMEDLRLLTLIGVAMEAIEELALIQNIEPELLLAELLFKANKELLEQGTQPMSNKLLNCYPVLNQAIA